EQVLVSQGVLRHGCIPSYTNARTVPGAIHAPRLSDDHCTASEKMAIMEHGISSSEICWSRTGSGAGSILARVEHAPGIAAARVDRQRGGTGEPRGIDAAERPPQAERVPHPATSDPRSMGRA